MTNKKIEYSMVANPNNKDCKICAGLNNLYQSNSFEKETRLPKSIGEGYCKRIALKPSVEVSIVDMIFADDIEIDGEKGSADSNFYDLAFCLEGSLRWQTKERGIEIEAHRGDSLMLCGEKASGLSNINGGQHFSYINIRMSRAFISDLLNQIEIDQVNFMSLCSSKSCQKNNTSLPMKRILYDIINCRLSQGLKKIYMEAKVMELLSVYMDEVVLGNRIFQNHPVLSKEDIVGLRRAKSILDTDIANAPSLSRLARLSHLNEYKLKKGFKTLFGQPVHAYIIDRRLEKARFLFESENLSVTDATQLVGYNDMGRFAEKFRKKFGVNPSEYRKTL